MKCKLNHNENKIGNCLLPRAKQYWEQFYKSKNLTTQREAFNLLVATDQTTKISILKPQEQIIGEDYY